jgi:hypothetical protein
LEINISGREAPLISTLDYAKTQKVLASCIHCYGEDDSPPKAAVIAMGTRCYLACTPNQELVPGHCHIVPIQHHLSTLEGDDDLWDEIKVRQVPLPNFFHLTNDFQNFMKCLIRMFNEEDKGVVFYETVISLRWQKHTCIECVPVPYNVFEDLPGYFKVGHLFIVCDSSINHIYRNLS